MKDFELGRGWKGGREVWEAKTQVSNKRILAAQATTIFNGPSRPLFHKILQKFAVNFIQHWLTE